MATGKSGVLTLSGTNVTAQITWNETYEISSNTSIITITKLQVKASAGSYFLNGSLTVNGVNVATFDSVMGTHTVNILNSSEYWPVQESNGNKDFTWKSNNIEHNSDGSKQISISLNVKTYEYPSGWLAWSINTSGNISLTTIPRASSLSLSASSVNVGGLITATITRASNSFTHKVEFYINNSYHQEFTSITTSKAFTIPDNWYNYMSSSTSCTAYCRITTYNGSTQIGSTVSKSFTVNVPSNIVPTCGTFTLNPADINNNNILVKGKNSLELSVSGCKAGTGSSIKSYVFSGPSFSKTISTTSASTSTSVSSVSDVGTLTYKVTITDARGRSSSTTKTIQCYDYYTPYFASFNAYRANSDGSANLNGSYLKYTYNAKYASVNSTNSISIIAYYNNKTVTASGNSGIINLNGDTNTTYKVYLKMVDSYGGSNVSLTLSVFGQTKILNVTSDGTGIAIGKMAESSNLFECRWPAKFDDNITLKAPLSIENGGTGANNSASALANIGAAPTGYGFGGAPISVGSGQLTTETALETALNAVYDAMSNGETKLVKFTGYPSTSDYNWFGLLSKSSANYGSLIVHSALNKGDIRVKAKYNGSWQPISNSVACSDSFAPSGYGLGSSEFFNFSNIDTITKPGWYYCNESSTPVGTDFSSNRWWLHVSGYAAGSTYATQELYGYASSTVVKLVRHKATNWRTWEFDNPPMASGTEYRTTERWNGKVVYTKLLTYKTTSALSGATTTKIAHGISNLDTASLRVEWTTDEWILPYSDGTEALIISGIDKTSGDGSKLIIKTNGYANWNSGRTFYIRMKYCKTS